jgi:hypothetical protein
MCRISSSILLAYWKWKVRGGRFSTLFGGVLWILPFYGLPTRSIQNFQLFRFSVFLFQNIKRNGGHLFCPITFRLVQKEQNEKRVGRNDRAPIRDVHRGWWSAAAAMVFRKMFRFPSLWLVRTRTVAANRSDLLSLTRWRI